MAEHVDAIISGVIAVAAIIAIVIMDRRGS